MQRGGNPTLNFSDSFFKCIRTLFCRWLFYIEGTITVVVALSAIFILPDFPSSSFQWLTPQELALARLRMKEDGLVDEGETDHTKGQATGLMLALSDWKVW